MNLKILLIVMYVSGSEMVLPQKTDENSLTEETDPQDVGYKFHFLHIHKKLEDGVELIKTKSLKGITVKVGLIEDDRYKYDCVGGILRGGSSTSRETYSEYLLNLLKDILKFKVRFVRVKSTTSEDIEVPVAKDNRTDVVLCHWTVTGRTPNTMEFLLPTLSTTESFVYQPRNLPLTQDVFVETFSRKLWSFFLMSVFLVIVFFRFSTSVHSRLRPDREPWTWDEVVLWAVAAISQQSFSKHPRGSSCRTTFLIGYTVAYLLYTGFAAGITSLLALQGHRDQLNFENAANMKLHLLYNVHEYHFDDSIIPDSRFAYDDFFRDAQSGDLSEIFSQIEKPNFVGIGSTPSLMTYMGDKIEYRKRESVSIVPVLHSSRQRALLVRKTFPYKEVFNYWLLRFMETGLVSLGQRRLFRFGQNVGSPSSKWLSADLGNVFSAVLFLFGGWVLSVLILFIEILWVKNKAFKGIYKNTKMPHILCNVK